ncbi:MAG: hypothetical protein ACI9W6_001837, partial [Motiliproteus sp.]
LLLGSDAPPHAAPDFTSRRAQPYWADEINHPLVPAIEPTS